MNKKVLLWLVENGLRLNKKGVGFLADAIIIYRNKNNIRVMEMYEIIGDVNQKSIRSVIRAMHHCIESDWHHTTFKKYTKGTPTVFEAIQLLELLFPWGDNND